jgi:hypothetical protein
MTDIITQFQSISQDFIKAITSFPAIKIEEKLFDQWSLKDVIAHLIGWDEHFIKELDNLQKNQTEKSIWVTVPDQNKKSIAKYQKTNFEDLVKIYRQTSQKLTKILINLPLDLQNQPLFPNKKSRTPSKYLAIWIKHLGDHLSEIKHHL